MKNIYIIILAIVVLAILIFVYIKYINKGYSSNLSPSKNTVQSVGPNTVTIKNLSFNPASLEVSKGTTVTWVNDDATEHTVTSNDKVIDSQPIAPQSKFEFTFNEAGEFGYHCSIHPTMTGKIIVK